MTLPLEVPKGLAGSPPARPEGAFVIGLTGPIGCGKSTVARMLAEMGATVIDADVLARRATAADAPALPEIRRRFGDGVFAADGSLDRAGLGRIVFADPGALSDLEQIVHPHVRRLVDQALRVAAEASDRVVAIEAIKLVEGGLAERCDEVWLVECSADSQRARLAQRGVPPADAEQRRAAQGPDLIARLAARLAERPHRVLSTDGPLEATRQRVEAAWTEALGRR